jgi:hypothetical protein
MLTPGTRCRVDHPISPFHNMEGTVIELYHSNCYRVKIDGRRQAVYFYEYNLKQAHSIKGDAKRPP